MPKYNMSGLNDSQFVEVERYYLIAHSAKVLPPVLTAIKGLGSPPYQLYSCLSYEKLHVGQVALRILRFFGYKTTCVI